jgi:predicted ATPase
VRIPEREFWGDGIAYRLKILSRVAKAEYRQAVDIALRCLFLFDIELPARPSREHVQVEYEKLLQNLGDRSIESLVDLPLMTDLEMQVLSVLVAPAFYTESNLFYLLVCHMVNTSLEYGTTAASSHGYAELACILGPVFHRYLEGYRFGRLACGLIEKYGFEAYKAKAYFCMERAVFWTQPLRTAMEFVRLANRAAIETHDLSYACFSYGHLVTGLLMQGAHLDEVWRESQNALEFVRNAKFRDQAGHHHSSTAIHPSLARANRGYYHLRWKALPRRGTRNPIESWSGGCDDLQLLDNPTTSPVYVGRL